MAIKRKASTLPAREADLSKLIKDQLEIYYKQGRLRYFRAHPVRPVTRKGKTFFTPVDESQKGISDFVVFLPDEVWFVETKKPGAKLRAEQERWKDWAEDKETTWYFKIDSVRMAYALLDVIEMILRGLPAARDYQPSQPGAQRP